MCVCFWDGQLAQRRQLGPRVERGVTVPLLRGPAGTAAAERRCRKKTGPRPPSVAKGGRDKYSAPSAEKHRAHEMSVCVHPASQIP